jgi:hypothetical protein
MLCRVGARVMKERQNGELTGRLSGYDARIKLCARRGCGGKLTNTVSSRVKAPLEDGKGVVLRTFRGTEVGVDEREELRKEGILLDLKNMGPVDPSKLLSGLVRLGTESRSVGMDPAEGNAGDCKSGGVASIVKKNLKERDEERKKRMKEVDGRTVRNRVTVTNVMRQHANDGLAYKGKVLEHSKHTRALRTWASKIETLGNAGVDTGMVYEVTLEHDSDCTCTTMRRTRDSKNGPFYRCRHYYAIMMKVLKFDKESALPHQMVFNDIEMDEVLGKEPDLEGLKGGL